MAERDTYAHGGASVAKGSKKTYFERKALNSDYLKRKNALYGR